MDSDASHPVRKQYFDSVSFQFIWSWASRTRQVTIYNNTEMREVIGILLPSKPWSQSEKELAFVCDIETITTHGDPMAQVTYGCLRMQGVLIPTVLNGNAKLKIRGIPCDVKADISTEKFVGRFFCVIYVDIYWWFDGPSYAAEGLLLRCTGNKKGQYERVGHISVSYLEGSFENAFRHSARSRAEREIIPEELYERYDNESGLYTFSIV